MISNNNEQAGQAGQVSSEYIILLSGVCLSLAIASLVVEDGNLIEAFVDAIRSRTLTLVTILRLPI